MSQSRYLEVWNDTVDFRHMVGGIALGVALAVPTFLVPDHFLAAGAGEGSLGHSYSLLAGIVACVVAAVVTGLLFKPKREVTEAEQGDRHLQATIDEIVEEYGPLGDPRELPSAVQVEVRELGLFDALVRAHERRGGEAP